ncbi:RagB/SusD family nutrient uptake outer membrane protein [Chitinophaga lutea]
MQPRFLIFLVCFLAAAGCKKAFLEQEPYSSSIAYTQYFKTLDQCNTSTQVCYRYINYTSWWETLNVRYLSGEAASDNAWIGNTYQATHATYDAVAHYTLDASNDRIEGHWIMLYKSVGVFNATIEGIQGAPIPDADKQRFIAELKFLRAWAYFDLVRNWGGVPLVLKIYPPEEHVARSTAREVYDQMVKDLTDAAAILPRKSEYPANYRFRATKGAALTLLTKFYLYMEEWAKAQTSAEQVIALGDYDLETSFSTLWQYNYKNGIESIFEIQNANSQVPDLPYYYFLTVVNSVADGGWGYYSLSSDLENAYKSEGDSIRLQWTINRHQLPVAGDPATPKFDGRALTQSKSGRFSRKHYIPKGQRPANNRFAVNDKILRFADLLLMHAEACAMQQKSADALGSYRRVRTRVGLNTDMTLTGWNLIRAVRKERRLEMAFEGDRLYDIRRWKDENGKPTIQNLFGPQGTFVKYNTEQSTDPWETGNRLEPQNKGFFFDPAKHMLWPIPNSQIISSEGVIKQNPNYF